MNHPTLPTETTPARMTPGQVLAGAVLVLLVLSLIVALSGSGRTGPAPRFEGPVRMERGEV